MPPGATLKETIEARGISQAELAARAGMAEKTISQIINGIAPITYETAEKLEMVLSIPARFWNRRELSYREAIARNEANERLANDVAWLKEMPVKELRERKCIDEQPDELSRVRAILQFFGVSSVDTWHKTWGKPIAQYRGGEALERHAGYVAAWLRMGELQADAIATEAFDASEFKRSLKEVRALTARPAAIWSKEIPKLCAPAGVAVVFTKEIPKARVSGATRWITKDKALIQLSLKYKTDDQLWFTFFHEAGHILLHGKRQIFVENGSNRDTAEEQQANAFARDFLIPPESAARLESLRTRQQIIAFAKRLGISPGIVVGRLQHDKLLWVTAFRDLKQKLDWTR
ncbi:MAG: helix-turn-helix domain-containing protein [Pirellulales bacterium]